MVETWWSKGSAGVEQVREEKCQTRDKTWSGFS